MAQYHNIYYYLVHICKSVLSVCVFIGMKIARFGDLGI